MNHKILRHIALSLKLAFILAFLLAATVTSTVAAAKSNTTPIDSSKLKDFKIEANTITNNVMDENLINNSETLDSTIQKTNVFIKVTNYLATQLEYSYIFTKLKVSGAITWAGDMTIKHPTISGGVLNTVYGVGNIIKFAIDPVDYIYDRVIAAFTSNSVKIDEPSDYSYPIKVEYLEVKSTNKDMDYKSMSESIAEDINPRQRMITIVDSKDRQDLRTIKYIAPGWLNLRDSNNYNNYLSTLAGYLYDANPNDRIITVESKQALGFSLFGRTYDKDEYYIAAGGAALWVAPTARAIAQEFIDQNIDINNMSLLGHSFGGYQSIMIVNAYNDLNPICKVKPDGCKAKSILLMNIAEDPTKNGFDIDINTPGIQSPMDKLTLEHFENSYSIVSRSSYADNKKLSERAHISMLMDSGTDLPNDKRDPGSDAVRYEDMGVEHGYGPKLEESIIKDKINIPTFGGDGLDPTYANEFSKEITIRGYSKFHDKTSNTDHSGTVVAKKYEVEPDGTIKELDKDIIKPQFIALKNIKEKEYEGHKECESQSSNELLLDSNENNIIQPYQYMAADGIGCDHIRADGGDDTVIAATKGVTILEGEAGHDVFDIRNLDGKSTTYIKDFGLDGDAILLNKKFEGQYSTKKTNDGTIELLLKDKVIANISGPYADQLIPENNPNSLSNNSNLVSYKNYVK